MSSSKQTAPKNNDPFCMVCGEDTVPVFCSICKAVVNCATCMPGAFTCDVCENPSSRAAEAAEAAAESTDHSEDHFSIGAEDTETEDTETEATEEEEESTDGGEVPEEDAAEEAESSTSAQQATPAPMSPAKAKALTNLNKGIMKRAGEAREKKLKNAVKLLISSGNKGCSALVKALTDGKEQFSIADTKLFVPTVLTMLTDRGVGTDGCPIIPVPIPMQPRRATFTTISSATAGASEEAGIASASTSHPSSSTSAPASTPVPVTSFDNLVIALDFKNDPQAIASIVSKMSDAELRQLQSTNPEYFTDGVLKMYTHSPDPRI